MERGIVKWFNNQKGFGFIKRSSGQDAFVHYSDIRGKNKTLVEGEEVMFDIVEEEIRTVVRNVIKL